MNSVLFLLLVMLVAGISTHQEEEPTRSPLLFVMDSGFEDDLAANLSLDDLKIACEPKHDLCSSCGKCQLPPISERRKHHATTSLSPCNLTHSDDGSLSSHISIAPKRSLSARSSLKSPQSPKRAKMVRFADVMGLDLEQVRHVLDTSVPPIIPAKAIEHLNLSMAKSAASRGDKPAPINKFLYATFALGSEAYQKELLEKQCVILESVSILDFVVRGVVRVKNFDFAKEVFVRYTLNRLSTFYDIRASYLPLSSDGFSDKFSFSLFLPDMPLNSQVFFAIKYTTQGREYWDNNKGSNYTLEFCGRENENDMTITLWDWENKWQNKQTFEGHTHYVMQVVINPKDNNTFATASLARTIKVWQLGSKDPNFTLEGHEKGVNCVDYYHGGEKPYIISGADDRLVKIWDYQAGGIVLASVLLGCVADHKLGLGLAVLSLSHNVLANPNDTQSGGSSPAPVDFYPTRFEKMNVVALMGLLFGIGFVLLFTVWYNCIRVDPNRELLMLKYKKKNASYQRGQADLRAIVQAAQAKFAAIIQVHGDDNDHSLQTASDNLRQLIV